MNGQVFSRVVFPAVVVASISAAIYSMNRGAPPAAAILPCIIVTYTFVALAERVFPLHRRWLSPQGDLGADISLALTNGIFNRVTEPPLLAAVVLLGGWVSRRAGLGLWPTGWHIIAQLCLALFIGEFFEYWFHRLMHEREVLWRIHATHHSAPRLYWLNAARFHPVDLALVGTGKLLPVAFLGAGEPVLALVTLFSAVHGTFQHANLQLKLGPLNWIFSMAELHRWHHSPHAAEANHNYGGNLILWDIIFGTRYLPADREPPEQIGIDDLPDFPTTFLGLLASPFRWSEIRRATRAAAAS